MPTRKTRGGGAEPRTLRRRALARLRNLEPDDLKASAPAEIRRVLHELRVHQVELEMQNEELRRIQRELELSRARYRELYEFAPVGYLTIDPGGRIVEANLAASTLLATPVAGLVKQRLTRFIVPEDQDAHYEHTRRLVGTGESQVYELRMLRPDRSVFWARLDASHTPGNAGEPQVRRVTISDVTGHREAEAALRESAQRLRQLAQELSERQEAKLALTSRDLHEDIAQILIALNLRLQLGRRGAERAPRREVDSDIAMAQQLFGDVLSRIRDIATDLHPPELDHFGLPASIRVGAEFMLSRLGVAVTVRDAGNTPRLPPAAEIALFRIAQEALNNVAEHARANRVVISFAQSGARLQIAIDDDGVGFDPAAKADSAGSWGLRLMRERAEAIGATLAVDAAPGRGTRIAIGIGCPA